MNAVEKPEKIPSVFADSFSIHNFNRLLGPEGH